VELAGIAATEIYGARAVKLAHGVLIIAARQPVEPPVVGEHSVGHVPLYGKHLTASPHIGIIEDADTDMRERACVPALGEGTRRQLLVEKTVGHLLCAGHGVKTAVSDLGIKLLGHEDRLEPVGDPEVDARAPGETRVTVHILESAEAEPQVVAFDRREAEPVGREPERRVGAVGERDADLGAISDRVSPFRRRRGGEKRRNRGDSRQREKFSEIHRCAE